LDITHINIYSSKIKNDVRLALASDLHNVPGDHIISALEYISPDIILMPGDIFDYPLTAKKPYQKYSFSFLEKASHIAPCYMSVGNHEGVLSSSCVSAISKIGVRLLDDQEASFSFGEDSIWIGGLSSPCGRNHFYSRWYTPPPDLSFLNCFSKHKGFKLLLSHHPEYYPRFIQHRDIDLTLSGHAHGGQIRLFGRGLFSPGQGFLPKLTSGVVDNRLVISRGLGNRTHLPRLFNHLELVIIQLSPKE